MSDTLKGANVKTLPFDISLCPRKMKYVLTVQSVPHETLLHVRMYISPAFTGLSVNHTLALQSRDIW